MPQQFDLKKEIYQRYKANQGIVWLVGEEPVRYIEAIESIVEKINHERKARAEAAGDPPPEDVQVWCHDKLSGWFTGLPGLTQPENGSDNTQVALLQAMGTMQQITAKSADISPPFDPGDDLVMVMNDVQDHIGKSASIRQQLRNISQSNLCSEGYVEDEAVEGDRGRRMLVLITPTAEIRQDNGRKVDLPEITPIRVPLPDSEVIGERVREQFEALAEVNQADPTQGCPMPGDEELEFITEALLGLTQQGAENALSRAIIANLTTDEEGNTQLVMDGLYSDIEDEKSLKVEETQGLEYVSKRDLPDEILPGYEPVVEFIEKRMRIKPSVAREHGNFQPLKGFLLAGSYGCGKTEFAKMVAKLTDRILLILNVGRVQGRYVGDSEENLERALQYAEAMNAILLLDDFDKAGTANSGDAKGGSGVMSRLTQMILTKSSDASSRVMYIVTANRVSNIETALKRPGRLDAQFFVEMPSEPTRLNIIRHHIARYKLGVDDEETLQQLASDGSTKRWSGAELAHVLVKEAAIEALANEQGEISTDLMLHIAANRTPFAEMPGNKEDIEQLEEDCEQFVHVGNVQATPAKKTPNKKKSSSKKRSRISRRIEA